MYFFISFFIKLVDLIDRDLPVCLAPYYYVYLCFSYNKPFKKPLKHKEDMNSPLLVILNANTPVVPGIRLRLHVSELVEKRTVAPASIVPAPGTDGSPLIVMDDV